MLARRPSAWIEDDNARLEAEERAAEANRQADAAARKAADDERAAAEKAAEERASEAKRLADARKKADDEAQARREQEDRVAAEKRATEEVARRQTEAERSKTEDPAERSASLTLTAEERASFVKKIQDVLKQSKCYDGTINGSSDEVQKSLDRYVRSAREKGNERPARIELAKATASDFDEWLRHADDLKGGICVPAIKPKLNLPTRERSVERPPVKERAVERAPARERNTERAPAREPRAERAASRPQPSYSSRPSYSSGGGGGGHAPIQGIQ